MSEKSTISEPILKRVSFDRYAAMPGMNFSRLKELARSPLNFQYRAEHPRRSQAMQLGTAAHTAVLEPHRFLAEYALWDEQTEGGKTRPRRGKDWDAFVAAHADKRIIKADEHGDAMAMRDAVRASSLAMRYLRRGDSEVVIKWKDEETGRECKCRLDWLDTTDGEETIHRGHVLVGLKTARDCRAIQFGNAAAKLGYHLQWAFYFDGYLAATGIEPKVVEIVVESAPPHDVAVYSIPIEVLDQGRDEYRALLVTLAACEASRQWPGASTEEQILTLPSWAYHAEDDISALGLEQ